MKFGSGTPFIYKVFYEKNKNSEKSKNETTPNVLEQDFAITTKVIREEYNMMPLVLNNYMKISFQKLNKLIEKKKSENDESKINLNQDNIGEKASETDETTAST